MTEIPRLAISVRQPWAWAIVYGGKDIENRTWKANNPGMRFRGDVAIHAAQGMTRDEYEDAAETINHIGISRHIECPLPDQLDRGGIIGVATVVDIVKAHPSPWFFGRYGLVLANVRPVTFIAAAGQLGFFEWSRMNPDHLPPPAKWMTTWGRAPAAPPPPVQTELQLPLSPLDSARLKATGALR